METLKRLNHRLRYLTAMQMLKEAKNTDSVQIQKREDRVEAAWNVLIFLLLAAFGLCAYEYRNGLREMHRLQANIVEAQKELVAINLQLLGLETQKQIAERK